MLKLLHPDVKSGKMHDAGHVRLHELHSPHLLDK
jgi:hypothetical protein